MPDEFCEMCYYFGFQRSDRLQVLQGTRLMRTIQDHWEQINRPLQFTIFRTNDALFDWCPGFYQPCNELKVSSCGGVISPSQPGDSDRAAKHTTARGKDAERGDDLEVKKR